MIEQEYKWQARGQADFVKFKQALTDTDFRKSLSKVFIMDSYFDDAQGTLAAQKAVLRLRSADGVYEAVYKTASEIKNGFVKRREETFPIFAKSHTRALSQFKGLVHKNWPALGPVKQLFIIKNKRQILLLESPSFAAEVCFDDCNILVGEKNIKMFEIEMELKKGDAAQLAELAQRLTKASGLNYAQVSKVATAFKNLC